VPDLPVDPRLDVVPAPSARRLAVRVTPDALRHVRAGHPWIFADSITSITDGGRPGDLAVVFDRRRAFAAIGLFDPDSPIRVKVLHHGAPATIDESWWRAAITGALDRRAPFVLAADASELGYRVVNGESDGMPGLVIDRYADALVVKV
jgi:23S rRNA (cytosine1962-C5)-methyltransferase